MSSTQEDGLALEARRVVSGLDQNGKSTIIVDEPTTSRTATKAFVLADIWRSESVPSNVDAPDVLTAGDVVLEPPSNGVVVRVSAVPPDDSWDPDKDYAEAMDAISYGDGDDAKASADEVPGMHTTDTIDVLTILSGELTAILETTETVLKAGDTFVQRGTKHAWANRGSDTCIAVATMIGAKR